MAPVCCPIVDSPSICSRDSVKSRSPAGGPDAAAVVCKLDTAPDVPLSKANAVTTQVTQAAESRATPINPSRRRA